MQPRFIIALLATLVLGCAHKDATRVNSKYARLVNSPPDIPTKTYDSTIYIGYVDYFPETKEFYTALHYKEGSEYPDEELLESKLDSVIMVDEDWGRERLPMEEAEKLLVLNGLDSISIYNRKNQLVCKSSLARVEYLWNGLESYFIGVFKSNDPAFEQTEELYGISTPCAKAPANISSEELSDPLINEFLLKKLHFSRSIDWDMRHYAINNRAHTLSVISGASLDMQHFSSYLAATDSSRVSILNSEEDSFQYLNILPVPYTMNGRPLLLITAGYPSSDVIWDYLAGFNGERYEAIDCNRVSIAGMGR